MTDDLLFKVLNAAVLPGWALLFFAPRWRWTATLVSGCVLPLLMAAAYLLLLVTSPRTEGGGFATLEQVRTLFQNPHAVLVGWVHYLAFDLFVGSWEVRDAQRLGLPHLLVVPCLFFTLMLGPVGLLLYFALRLATRRKLALSVEQP
jgi:hypothetical protein